jgi:hypothetical protein
MFGPIAMQLLVDWANALQAPKASARPTTLEQTVMSFAHLTRDPVKASRRSVMELL